MVDLVFSRGRGILFRGKEVIPSKFVDKHSKISTKELKLFAESMDIGFKRACIPETFEIHKFTPNGSLIFSNDEIVRALVIETNDENVAYINKFLMNVALICPFLSSTVLPLGDKFVIFMIAKEGSLYIAEEILLILEKKVEILLEFLHITSRAVVCKAKWFSILGFN